MYKYAVVHWYNYRKELSAGFVGGFHDFEEARKYAFLKAELDAFCNGTDYIITEDEITDKNGPEKSDKPYKSLIGYGGSKDGYATTFYSVVEWFDAVTNYWEWSESDDYWEEKYNGQWYPKYE